MELPEILDRLERKSLGWHAGMCSVENAPTFVIAFVNHVLEKADPEEPLDAEKLAEFYFKAWNRIGDEVRDDFLRSFEEKSANAMMVAMPPVAIA